MSKVKGYIAIFNGKRIDIFAESLYAAKLKAIKKLKPPKSKQHMVTVMLAQNEDGDTITHVADF